jgi:hypothetical protein
MQTARPKLCGSGGSDGESSQAIGGGGVRAGASPRQRPLRKRPLSTSVEQLGYLGPGEDTRLDRA